MRLGRQKWKYFPWVILCNFCKCSILMYSKKNSPLGLFPRAASCGQCLWGEVCCPVWHGVAALPKCLGRGLPLVCLWFCPCVLEYALVFPKRLHLHEEWLNLSSREPQGLVSSPQACGECPCWEEGTWIYLLLLWVTSTLSFLDQEKAECWVFS